LHEYSIASQIWQSVRKAAEERGGGRILSISLEIGALNLLEDEQLSFWIRALAERDGSSDVQLNITHLPGRIECAACGARDEPALPAGVVDHFVAPPLACRVCGSRDVRIVGGRELRVVSAEIQTEQSDE
jgi:hydrogenase nickel insertion protein HypA